MEFIDPRPRTWSISLTFLLVSLSSEDSLAFSGRINIQLFKISILSWIFLNFSSITSILQVYFSNYCNYFCHFQFDLFEISKIFVVNFKNRLNIKNRRFFFRRLFRIFLDDGNKIIALFQKKSLNHKMTTMFSNKLYMICYAINCRFEFT